MGLFDFLFGKSNCPRCGSKGARRSEQRVRCPNPSCCNFDASLGRGGILRNARRARRSDYSPKWPIEIRYRNFQGVEKTFIAERETLRRKRNHIIAQVAPTGENIALSRDRMQNLAEVEEALPDPRTTEPVRSLPTARERQVLAFHKKHKSTSPLYEATRAKYPDW